jgi:predicted ATPase/DNA-binding winged helix-turn-helix (wHTH) protein
MRTDAIMNAAVASAASVPGTEHRSGVIEIGNIQLDPDMRTLRRHGETVPVGSRAFDILVVLARANGRLVSKDELMSSVWPRSFVEENNIHVHLSVLRKLLGDDRDLIVNVPGRGYQLSRRRYEKSDERFAACDRQREDTVARLAGASSLIGRDDALVAIGDLLADTRVLTLVGAGGVGKSTLAAEAARRFAAHSEAPVHTVALAVANGRDAALGAIARQCAVSAHAPPPNRAADLAGFAERFGAVRGLLILDNAEHVIAPVAEFIDALTAVSDHLRVLVTSREPMRIMTEMLYRIDPLDVPDAHATPAQLSACASVRLFLSRAHAMQAHCGEDGEEDWLIGEICRRLGGNPLAIELAAARLTALGLEDIHQCLDDPLTFLTGGYRTALPRHRTLRASFDWSYALLDANQQALFRRISVFESAFTLEAMCAVACDDELSPGRAVDGASELVAKSLLAVEFDGACAQYRLSETTRAYARDKLRAQVDTGAVASRHAVQVVGTG